MVGDRKHDIEAANINGIASVAVLWGYGDIEEFQKEGATHVVDNVEELKKLVT